MDIYYHIASYLAGKADETVRGYGHSPIKLETGNNYQLVLRAQKVKFITYHLGLHRDFPSCRYWVEHLSRRKMFEHLHQVVDVL
jgi:hypothetical protein